MAKKKGGLASTDANISSRATPPEHLRKLLQEVGRLLNEGEAEQAIALIARSGERSDWVTNAKGVCQLRAGDATSAVQTFRRLAVTGLYVRADVPPVFVANFAAAMMATGNFDGYAFAMSSLSEADHPSVARYRSEYGRWLEALPPWKRLFRRSYSRRFQLTPPLGDLM